jgi:hypothetical protein
MYAIGARIYMKPLLPGDAALLDIGKTLQAGKRSLLRQLRGKLLQQTVFSPAAKQMLSKAVQVKIKQSSLQIVSNHPGFLPLLKGQDRMQMKWLTKARAPIPIVLDSGKLIFRNATPAGMARGAWWHPGRTPTNYIDKATELTRKFMRNRMMKEFEKNLRLRMSGAGKKSMKTR